MKQLLKNAGITVQDTRFYRKVLLNGSLGFGEAYMDGWWDAKKLDVTIEKLLRENKQQRLSLATIIIAIRSLFNLQRLRSGKVSKEHYNIGNELYQKMLGKTMQYSCGYWKNAKSLDEAQFDKMELIAKKLKLKPGMRVLDIGGGFGSLAHHLAKHHGCRVTVYNMSSEQVSYGKKLCKGLPVTFYVKDYREVQGSFDRVVSVGFFEHVGVKNYYSHMKLVTSVLKDDGLFLLHTIGSNVSRRHTDPWIDKYIFPDGMLPSIKQIGKATEGIFVMEDWHNFGPDYEKTLLAWEKNFRKAWPIKGYDERFYRMWRFYLMSCAAAFRVRNIQLWQVVFSKGRNSYERVS